MLLTEKMNYPDRKALILNTCPCIELSGFSFGNFFVERNYRAEQKRSWKNVGFQPVLAFVVVVLKYDAFDERIMGSRWTIAGKNGGDWQPLAPGEVSGDGTLGHSAEEVFTAIAYVRSARLADGSVWRVDEILLARDLGRVAPGIGDFGSAKPDPRKTSIDGVPT